MKTIKINENVEVKAIEHMKEIQENCDNAWLFKKWYNKKQMFKALLGQFKYVGMAADPDEDDAPSTYGDWGDKSGCLVHLGSTCWFIELYKVEDLSAETLDSVISQQSRNSASFFIEDGSGTLYLVRTNVD